MIQTLKSWARAIKRDVHALYLASRDPAVSWHVKLLAGFVAAYALSPIDLIPDFIPVLGLVDDAILLPLGIWLVVRLIPPDVMLKHRLAAEAQSSRPVARGAAIVIVALWVALVSATAWLAYDWLAKH
jgi:uncharacterized membrane protein YkvA (DUF1232 family)